MSVVRNIPFGPTEPQQPQPPQARQHKSYTRLDNDVDLTLLLAELPNALVKPALFLMSRRNLRTPAVHWGEVAAATRRSQPQTTRALSVLQGMGLATSEGGLWRWSERKPNGKPEDIQRKSYIDAPENAVLHDEKQAPELKELKELKEVDVIGLECAHEAQHQHLGAAGDLEGQTPDGVASDEAELTPDPLTEKTMTGTGGTENVTDPEKVPGGRTPREAMAVLAAASLQDTWRGWVRLTAIPRVTQEHHAVQWAEWVSAGQTEDLKTHVAAIIEAGTYNMPWAALKHRMTRPAGPAPLPAVEVQRRTSFRPGQRVRFPDGSEATVVSVLSRSIITDHPKYPDVPLGRLKALEVLE